MSEAPPITLDAVAPMERPGTRGQRWGLIASALILLGLFGLAVFGPALAPKDPNAVNLSIALESPSPQHWLGTDASGRDIFSRLLAGARTSLAGALFISAVATSLGSALAIVAALRRGLFDYVFGATVNTIFAFPGLLLAILAVAVFGPGFVAPVVALAVANIPYVARVVRAGALRECALPYVAVCEINGFSNFRMCTRHLLPNLIEIISIQGALVFSYSLVDVAAINFLGLGIQPPRADWGVMVATGQSSILRARPEEALFASAMIVISVVTVNLFAESLSRRQY